MENLIIPNIYYINLDRSPNRNKNMITFFSKLKEMLNTEFKYERIKALDGNKINDLNSNEYLEMGVDKYQLHSIYISFLQNLPLNKGQFGCTYSHFKALIKFYESKDNFGIICEDDLSDELIGRNTFMDTLRKVLKNINNYGLISLSCNGPKNTILNQCKKLKYNSIFLDYKINYYYGTGMYMISRQKAKSLIKNYTNYFENNCNNKIKIKNLKKKSCVADILIYDHSKAKFLMPPLFLLNENFDSTIEIFNKKSIVNMIVTQSIQDIFRLKWKEFGINMIAGQSNEDNVKKPIQNEIVKESIQEIKEKPIQNEIVKESIQEIKKKPKQNAIVKDTKKQKRKNNKKSNKIQKNLILIKYKL